MSKENKVLPILMFCALPASGKSESRRFFKSLSKEEMAQFHLGDSRTQVDDYPYVDALEKIDAICNQTLSKTIFKDPNTRLFFSGYEWGVLTYLIKEDYLFKIIILGDCAVGKSNIASKYSKNIFNKSI